MIHNCERSKDYDVAPKKLYKHRNGKTEKLLMMTSIESVE